MAESDAEKKDDDVEAGGISERSTINTTQSGGAKGSSWAWSQLRIYKH